MSTLTVGTRLGTYEIVGALADKGAAHVTFLLNFFDELRRKVPVDR